jgi:hypothetical protein
MRQMQVLSDEAIRAYAPSVFAEEPSYLTSDRYRFFPTYEVLNGLRANGFLPVMAKQTRVRDGARKSYTKHMIRFRHEIYNKANNVGDLIPEMVLTNAHDGTSSYRLLAALLRLVCLNGMVAGGVDKFDMRVRHKGDERMVEDVIDASFEIIETFPEVLDAADEMSKMPITQRQAMAYAEAAHSLRWHKEDERGVVHAPIAPEQLLQRRRVEDNVNTVFGVFNVVQENLMKGGIAGYSAKRRPTRTREIKNITEDIRLNRALWILAESLKDQVAV